MLHLLDVAGEVADVAAQGRGAGAELGGEGAVGNAGHQGPVDVVAFTVMADGTGFRHEAALLGWHCVTGKK